MSKGFKSPGKMTKRVPEMLAKFLQKMKVGSSIEVWWRCDDLKARVIQQKKFLD